VVGLGVGAGLWTVARVGRVAVSLFALAAFDEGGFAGVRLGRWVGCRSSCGGLMSGRGFCVVGGVGSNVVVLRRVVRRACSDVGVLLLTCRLFMFSGVVRVVRGCVRSCFWEFVPGVEL